MKRNIFVLVLMLIILFSMVIVNIKQKENIEINIQDLGKQIIEEGEFEDELELTEKEIALKNYNLDQTKIKDIVYYTGSGATAEEILLIELNDKNDIQEIKQKMETRIEEQKEVFQNYFPKEVQKLENSLIKIQGKYAILSISKDSSQNMSIINQYIKER